MKTYYRQGWVAAAGVVFLMLMLMALLRGAEFQAVPPPSFCLLPPGYAATKISQGFVPPSEPYAPPSNEVRTVSIDTYQAGTLADGSTAIAFHVCASTTNSVNNVIQVSTNLVDWWDCSSAIDVGAVNESGVVRQEIVGYTACPTNGKGEAMFFRAVPQ